MSLAVVLVLAVAGCRLESAPKTVVLLDFESDAELDRLYWKCHVLYSLSDEHVTSGSKSLRMELYPSEYPGLAPLLTHRDWSRYKALAFDFYNTMSREVPLTVRIDDREGYPDYADRCNETVLLKPGENRVVMPLAALKTSGTKRALDWSRVSLLLMFVIRPEEKTILYADNIRLTR